MYCSCIIERETATNLRYRGKPTRLGPSVAHTQGYLHHACSRSTDFFGFTSNSRVSSAVCPCSVTQACVWFFVRTMHYVESLCEEWMGEYDKYLLYSLHVVLHKAQHCKRKQQATHRLGLTMKRPLQYCHGNLSAFGPKPETYTQWVRARSQG